MNEKDIAAKKFAETRWEWDYIDILRWRLNLPRQTHELRPGTACSEPYGWFGSDGKTHVLSERAKDRIQRRVMKRVDLALCGELVVKREEPSKRWGDMNEAEKIAAWEAAFGKPETEEKKPSIMDVTRMFG